MRPIGIIHSPFTEKEQTPIQSARSQARGSVQIYQEYAEGLDGLEGFSHIFLFYVLHRSGEYSLRVKPFLDDRLHGIFATRYPARPNSLGFSLVKVLALRDNVIEVEGLDVLDGTPLLDIKPFVPEFDQREATRCGWYETRAKE